MLASIDSITKQKKTKQLTNILKYANFLHQMKNINYIDDILELIINQMGFSNQSPINSK